MDKAIEVAKEDFATIRTGRANPAMFAKVLVEYYGTPTPLQQLASFNTPEPRSILISPFDMTSMAAIERAIRDSDLGVNPSNDGKTIRVVLPLLTEERRREYIKLARQEGAGSTDQAPRRVRRPVVGAQGERAPRGLMTQPSSIDVLARPAPARL